MCLDLLNLYYYGSVLCRSALIKSDGSIHNNLVGICRSEYWLYVGSIPSCLCAASYDPATVPLILFLFVGATLLLLHAVSASLFICCILIMQDFSLWYILPLSVLSLWIWVCIRTECPCPRVGLSNFLFRKYLCRGMPRDESVFCNTVTAVCLLLPPVRFI